MLFLYCDGLYRNVCAGPRLAPRQRQCSIAFNILNLIPNQKTGDSDDRPHFPFRPSRRLR
jgi:hypothetical protein